MKKKIGIVDILQLQGAVIVYSLSTVAGKLASEHPFLSFKYILFFGLEFVILAVYALIWQQMIKKFQISVASAYYLRILFLLSYWNFLLFSTGITPWKVVGVVLVIVGVMIMNMGADEDNNNKADDTASGSGAGRKENGDV